MIHWERIVAGCVLVIAGFGLIFVGYQKVQPTPSDQVVGVLEKLSGETAPDGLKSSKTQGFALLGGGTLLGVTGLALILKSRASDAA